ncbi:MAG: hypothetical protein QM778_18795 [Myxococcales bacterium]
MHESDAADIESQATQDMLMRHSVLMLFASRTTGEWSQGTGTFFETDRHHYLVTAAHVAEDLGADDLRFGLILQPGGSKAIFEPERPDHWILGNQATRDVAAFRLARGDVQEIKRAGFRFLRVSDFADGEFGRFAIYGYPKAMTTIDHHGLHKDSVWLEVPAYEGSERCGKNEFLLKWHDGIDFHLGGVSGSPVWAVLEQRPGSIWGGPTAHYKFCGIQISIKKGEWIKFVQAFVVGEMLDLADRIQIIRK